MRRRPAKVIVTPRRAGTVAAGSARLAALAVLVGILGACGNPLGKDADRPSDSRSLSGSDVEKTIDQKIPPQFPAFDVGRATCPDSLDPGKGRPGFCTITFDGAQAKVAVTRDSEKSASYQVATTQALINTRQLETTLARETRGLQAAHCGASAVRVIDPPGTIECTGRTAEKSVTLEVSIQDIHGRYSVAEKR